jgi:hypothetical protein
VRRHSQLNLNYSGAAFFYSRVNNTNNFDTQAPGYGSFHRLSFSQTVDWRRWKLLLGDTFSYLPESPFGFAGFGGSDSFGAGLGGGYFGSALSLSQSLLPNQTILTGDARRFSNVAVTQVEYIVGERSAITATGSYGTLRFLDSGFINSDYWTLQAGYNYALSRHNTIAITYLHSLFRLGAANREVLNRGFQMAYGRRLTGKLSLEISGGPMVSQVALPLGGSVTRPFWNTYDSLGYRFQKGGIEASFIRYTTAGSGVLAGAESDLTNLSIHREFLRRYFWSLTLGHAYNQSLTRESPAFRRSKYETWQGGLLLSRELGQHLSLYVNYYVQRQIANNPLCFGNHCLGSLLRQVGGIGVNWHGRPVKLD